MIIRVDEIPEGGKDLLFTGDEPGLKEALQRLTDPADVQIDPHIAGRLRVVRDGDLVYLVGPIAGTASHQCSRCLEAFTRRDRSRSIWSSGGLAAPASLKTRSMQRPMKKLSCTEGNEFDPTDALVQEFMLDMPINPLYKETAPVYASIAGPSRVPTNVAVNPRTKSIPRWAALDESRRSCFMIYK